MRNLSKAIKKIAGLGYWLTDTSLKIETSYHQLPFMYFKDGIVTVFEYGSVEKTPIKNEYLSDVSNDLKNLMSLFDRVIETSSGENAKVSNRKFLLPELTVGDFSFALDYHNGEKSTRKVSGEHFGDPKIGNVGVAINDYGEALLSFLDKLRSKYMDKDFVNDPSIFFEE